MATLNRAALIARTIKVLKKHYKPFVPPKDRSLFEHLLFACLLEDSPPEAAEQVFATLKRDYYDWNEVRVSTIRELSDVLKPLVNPQESAARLKQTLHAVFESVYQFDIETLKKQNIGQAVKQLEKYNGTTPFVVAYVTQMALGGHSIPVNRGVLVSMQVVGVISDAEYEKGAVTGLERSVPKSKGVEVGSLLHQLGVEVGRSPYGQTARKLLLEIAPDAKDRLPKRQTQRPKAAAPTPPPATTPGKGKPAAAAPARPRDAKPAKGEKQPAAKPTKKPPKKTTPPTKRPTTTKKPTKPGKKKTKQPAKKPTGRGMTKRKPR